MTFWDFANAHPDWFFFSVVTVAVMLVQIVYHICNRKSKLED